MTQHRHPSCRALLFVLPFLYCISPQIIAAETPLALSHHAQLLLDDRIIASSTNLKRTIHRPTMYADNPVLAYERPWEYSCVTLWGSVLFDEEDQKFKMWYQTWGDVVPGRKSMFICYAESPDGIHWTKPNLGIYEFEGSKKNNIAIGPQDMWLDSPTVVKDLNEPDPGKRYKMSFHESGPTHPPLEGIWHATSADGIHFTRMEGPVVQAGDRNSLFWDSLRKKWVVITRLPGREDRTISFAEGSEFGKYSPMRLVFEKDDLDPLKSDLYSMPTFFYEGMLIGYPEVYDHESRREITQLAWSYDGETWIRDPERQPFMLWGEKPAWDWARRHPHSGPMIRRDGKLWLYFGGRSTLKNSTHPKRIIGAIGLAFLRIDGFCSRDAGPQDGTLTTRLLQFEGNQLMVNANLAPSAQMKVAVLDAQGDEIPGFAADQCIPITGDSVQHNVSWQNPRSLEELNGRLVRLRFSFRSGEMYSFRLIK